LELRDDQRPETARGNRRFGVPNSGYGRLVLVRHAAKLTNCAAKWELKNLPTTLMQSIPPAAGKCRRRDELIERPADDIAGVVNAALRRLLPGQRPAH
jgi:hypothetical protein